MTADTIQRKVHKLMRLCDLNGDGYLERSDAEIWIDRLAAIRGWDKGSPGYERLDSVFGASFERLSDVGSDKTGRVEVAVASRVVASMAWGPF